MRILHKILTMTFVPPKYDTKSTDFFRALKTRTDEYFKKKDIEKKGGFRMYFKTFFMITSYLTPYFFILFADIQNPWKFRSLGYYGIVYGGNWFKYYA